MQKGSVKFSMLNPIILLTLFVFNYKNIDFFFFTFIQNPAAIGSKRTITDRGSLPARVQNCCLQPLLHFCYRMFPYSHLRLLLPERLSFVTQFLLDFSAAWWVYVCVGVEHVVHGICGLPKYTLFYLLRTFTAFANESHLLAAWPNFNDSQADEHRSTTWRWHFRPRTR